MSTDTEGLSWKHLSISTSEIRSGTIQHIKTQRNQLMNEIRQIAIVVQWLLRATRGSTRVMVGYSLNQYLELSLLYASELSNKVQMSENVLTNPHSVQIK